MTANNSAGPEQYLSATKVAALAGCSPVTIRDWASRNIIPGYRPGGREWLFLWSEVDAAIRATRQQASSVEPREARRQPRVGAPAPVTNLHAAFRQRQALDTGKRSVR